MSAVSSTDSVDAKVPTRAADDTRVISDKKGHLSYSKSIHNPADPKKATVSIEGYLMKQNSDKISWSKRYFVINQGLLMYRKDEKDQNPPVFAVNLLYTQVRALELPGRPFCFEVKSTYKTYVLEAKDDKTRQNWVRASQGAAVDALKFRPSFEVGLYLLLLITFELDVLRCVSRRILTTIFGA